MTDDTRTVADVVGAHIGPSTAMDACEALGLDPDMPYQQFRRLLAIGERAEKAENADRNDPGIDPYMPYQQFRRRLAMGERAEKAEREDEQPYSYGTWNDCLDHIRGDP